MLQKKTGDNILLKRTFLEDFIMKSNFSRFLYHTLSHSDVKHQSTSMLSYSGLTRISRWDKLATWFDLDHRVKPDGDRKGKDASLKPDGDSLCAGRSMVEMLGVLAIIGVLSVGAIAGYSKAMMKYKLNKHAEQMNTVINAVARNAHSFGNLSVNGSPNVITPIFIKMGEIPTEMVKSAGGEFIYDIFGQSWQIFIASDGYNILLTSWLENGSSFLSSGSSDSLAICQNILTVAKENADSILAITATSATSDSSLEGEDRTSYKIFGDKYCSANKTCLKNLTLDDIYTVCAKHIKNGKAVFQFLWSRR